MSNCPGCIKCDECTANDKKLSAVTKERDELLQTLRCFIALMDLEDDGQPVESIRCGHLGECLKTLRIAANKNAWQCGMCLEVQPVRTAGTTMGHCRKCGRFGAQYVPGEDGCAPGEVRISAALQQGDSA